MPIAAALLKLAFFIMWARPTYKMTIDMYERRERRLGLLPEHEETPIGTNDRTEAEDAPPAPPPARPGRARGTKQTRKK